MPRRIVAVVLLIFFSGASVLFACSCGRPAPACVYARNAKVIFLGKVTFTNEDHSGTFLQQTLVRFQVEEAFKGLSADAREVWIDPGSFTCVMPSTTLESDIWYLVMRAPSCRPV